MPSLLDQYCPNVHDAPVTAASYDPWSGVIATADADGVVAVQRRGENSPGLIFKPGAGVMGAIDVIRGGSLVAVGDETGSVGVYATDNGKPTFQELREGPSGRVRAMRGVALSPEGAWLASIAVDGLMRVWNLTKAEREISWSGFGGASVEFDGRGDRILCLDEEGQVRLVDMRTRTGLPMDKLQTVAEHAVYTHDGTMVVAMGPGGINLLRVVDGRLVGSFATRGGSGLLALLLNHEGDRAAAVTQRSTHVFKLPELEFVESIKHGAPHPTGAAYWAHTGLRVAGNDGLLYGGGTGGPGTVAAVGGFGRFRVVAHEEQAFVWDGDSRRIEIRLNAPVDQIRIDRDGRLVATLDEEGQVTVHDATTGKRAFKGGPDSAGAREVAVGGDVVAVFAPDQGVQWWDLGERTGFRLDWPIAMALSGSGTWLAVVTPRGEVRVLDPATGKDAIPAPEPLADDVPVRLISFVNRRADLLILDRDGVLGHYDLAEGIRSGQPAVGRDVIELNVPADRIWGITGGKACAMRLPSEDEEQSTIIWVNIDSGKVVFSVENLDRWAWVDPEQGLILEPGRSAAMLERDTKGREARVLRSLADNQWICFSAKGILQASESVTEALS